MPAMGHVVASQLARAVATAGHAFIAYYAVV